MLNVTRSNQSSKRARQRKGTKAQNPVRLLVTIAQGRRAHELLSLPFAKELDLGAKLGDVLREGSDDGHFEEGLRRADGTTSGRGTEGNVTCMGIPSHLLYNSSHGPLMFSVQWLSSNHVYRGHDMYT